MEKRKAGVAMAASPDSDDRVAKRRKIPDFDPSTIETPESAANAGRAFLEQLKQTKDKRGRPVVTNFLTLPDQHAFPDYYQHTLMPIAIDTIEAKISRFEYPNVTAIESDVKRMVQNAKSYNNKSSEVFGDAERIRKMVSEYMKKHNPAYRDPSYRAYPTPLPGEEIPSAGPTTETYVGRNGEMDVDGDLVYDQGQDLSKADQEDTRRKRGRPRREQGAEGSEPPISSSNGGRGESVASATPSSRFLANGNEGFQGMTFQAAQEKLMAELMTYQNEDDLPISQPFINLPSRSLKDYYAVIKHPVSLKQLEKRVHGIQGKEKTGTGVSDFQSWDAFARAVSFIWQNAREYNEDKSEISTYATELEAYFIKRLSEAAKAAPDPPQPSGPRVKLNFSQPKIRLRVGGIAQNSEALNRVSQSPPKQGPATPSIRHSNGDPAFSPHQSNVLPNGHAGPSQIETRPTTIVGAGDGTRSTTGSTGSPALAAVKSEGGAAPSPTLGANRPDLARSGNQGNNQSVQSPYLNAPVAATPVLTPLAQGSHAQQFPSPAAYHSSYNTQHHPPANPFDDKFRKPGKEALISNLSITTHPVLDIPRPFRLDIPPSATFSQQSVTMSLPSSHNYLRIVPTISSAVGSRQYRILLTVNGNRLTQVPQPPPHSDTRTSLYEAQILPGVNRVEMDLVVGPPRGAPKTAPGQDVELERVTVFVHLMKP